MPGLKVTLFTSSKNDKKELKETQGLLDSSLDVICSIDQEGKFIKVSAAVKIILGYDPEELIGKKYMDLVVDEDQEKTKQASHNIMAGVNITNLNSRYRCKDGSTIPIIWSFRWDANQKIMYGVAKDGSETQKIETELRDKKTELLKTAIELKAKNRRLKELNDFIFFADMVPQIIWTSNPDGNVDYHNQKWYDYTGLTTEQTDDGGWLAVLHPEDAIICHKKWTDAVEIGEDYEIECRIKRASDGLHCWHLVRAKPRRNQDGTIVKWFGSCTYIHDHKIMQDELKKTNAELTNFRNLVVEEVQKRSQFLNGVLKNMPVIVYRIDENGITTDSMGSGLKLVGLNEGEAVGYNALESYPDLICRIEDMHSGKSNAYESKNVYQENELFFQNYLFPDELNPGAVLGFALDITEKKKAEIHLKDAKLQAENANQFKTRFLASMSHEIRTPLNAILGFSRILKSTDISTLQSHEYLNYIESSGSVLLKLIGDILDLSKIEAGKLSIQEEQFAFKETMQELINPYKFKANEMGLEFALILDPGIPNSLIGDSYRINQIIINLIGNSLKFTKEGSITISFTISKNKPIDSESIILHLTVQDTGIGISSEKQAVIFESFTQADDSIVKEFGGSGLGLSITSQLICLMGGSIKVISPVKHDLPAGGPGTLFDVHLPLKIDNHHPCQKSYTTTHNSICVFQNEIKILVAEDNELNQRLAGFLLKKMGCSAEIVNNGLEAVERVRNNTYDLILMDVQMPFMDGFSATKKIRSEIDNDIPIIGLTANVFREDIEDCLNAGMSDHLGKPYNQEQLYSIIERWYSKKTDS